MMDTMLKLFAAFEYTTHKNLYQIFIIPLTLSYTPIITILLSLTKGDFL